MVVDERIPAREGLGGRWQPLQPAGSRSLPTWRQKAVREPPQKSKAQHHGDKTVYEKHPLEAYQAPSAVHELKAGRDEANDGSRHLSGGKVHANALSS